MFFLFHNDLEGCSHSISFSWLGDCYLSVPVCPTVILHHSEILAMPTMFRIPSFVDLLQLLPYTIFLDVFVSIQLEPVKIKVWKCEQKPLGFRNPSSMSYPKHIKHHDLIYYISINIFFFWDPIALMLDLPAKWFSGLQILYLSPTFDSFFLL